MAYKPPKQTIADNDLSGVPSNEAVFEALKLKLDEPSVSGTNGQLLQLDGYVSGEPVTSWVNPPAAGFTNPMTTAGDMIYGGASGAATRLATGTSEYALISNGSTVEWRILGTGSTGAAYPTNSLILGKVKPAGFTSQQAILLGTGTTGNTATGLNNILIGYNTAPALTSGASNVVIGNATTIGSTASDVVLIGQGAGQGSTGRSVSIGSGASAGGFGSHAIGYGATDSYWGLAVGYAASSTNQGVALGTSAATGAGSDNTVIGTGAGRSAATSAASNNTIIGRAAGDALTSGASNVFVGKDAGGAATTGGSNVIVGAGAGTGVVGAGQNVIIGALAQTTNMASSYYSTIIGYNAQGGTGSDNTVIGAASSCTFNFCTVVGSTSSASSQGLAIGYSATSAGGIAIGNSAKTGTSADNIVIGNAAGRSAGTGTRNIIIGAQAGDAMTSFFDAVLIGHNAGGALTGGGYNTCIGSGSGDALTTGGHNVLLGWDSGGAISSSGNNVAIGSEALKTSTSTAGATIVGRAACSNVTNASNSVVIGYQSGQVLNSATSNSTFLGYEAGKAVTTGTGNLFLGYTAGDAVTTGSNNTIIGDIDGTTTLADTVIVAAGTAERFRVDSSGNMGIGTTTPTEKLEVNGNIKGGTISFNADSNRTGTVSNLGFKSNTITHDFGSISHGDSAEVTITVSGAAVGDAVFVGPPAAPEIELGWSAYVSAADTVTLRVYNTHNSNSVNPASATWRVTVLKS